MYQVCGPGQPQGDPPRIYRTSDISHAYGIMIESRRLTGKKDVHVYSENNNKNIRVCRQCNKTLNPNSSGCRIHLNDFKYIPSLEKITQFSGVTATLNYFQYDAVKDRIKVINPTQVTITQSDDVYSNVRDQSDDEQQNDVEIIESGDFSSQSDSSQSDSSDDSNEVILYEPIHSDNRKYRMFIGTEIVLEGLIGIGKSTLGHSLAKYLNSIGYNTKFFHEFVNNELLSLYISNMEKYAFSYQVIMAKERIRIYEEARLHSECGGISIIDRSLIGDVAFATMQRDKGFISEIEWDVYRNILESERKFEPFATVFLKGTPQHAYEQMLKLSLPSEIDGYNLEYLEELDQSYHRVMSEMHTDVITIPWGNKRFLSDSQLFDGDCKHVLDCIREYYI